MSESNNVQLVPARKKSKPKKYVPNEAIDRKIRQIYAERIDKRIHALPNLKEYAKQIGWPHWAVKKRAVQLGIARTKPAPWSEKELKLLERWSYLTDARIRLKLKKAGFHRTEVAIHLKIKRLQIKQASGYYSARSLAGFFGIDSHTVTRWIGLGYLKAERRGTDRTAKQGGDIWLIREMDIRKFILAHPMEFDIRKITDQLWFMDLVTIGQICS